MHLRSEQLLLVRQNENDPEITELLNDISILENLSESRSYPAPMPSSICFKIIKDGALIGQACLKAIKWINHKSEISIFIKKEMQSKGYGSEALTTILDYGFNRLNLYRMEAEVIDSNTASIKILKQHGFREEGRLREAKFVNGKYKDLLRFGLLKKEYSK
jgi:RimJ/RimL family protein N-acetyltransferase